MVKGSQRLFLGTVGFRLCQREHRDSTRGCRDSAACSHTYPETQDCGHPLMRAPPSAGKAHVSPSNCRNFIFALSTFPSFLSLQPLGWVSWTQGYPSRKSEAHPRVFWHGMFQICTDTCVCCMCVHPSAVCRHVTQDGQEEMWPKP